jgi:hypothetical protein
LGTINSFDLLANAAQCLLRSQRPSVLYTNPDDQAKYETCIELQPSGSSFLFMHTTNGVNYFLVGTECNERSTGLQGLTATNGLINIEGLSQCTNVK